MAEVGARGREEALELDARHDVLVDAETVLAAEPRVEDLEAGGGDDGADLDRLLGVGVVMLDGAGDTGLHALVALAADAAFEAAVRFGDGLGLAEPETHFHPVGAAHGRVGVGVLHAGFFLHVLEVPLVGKPLLPVSRAAGLHVLALQVAVDGLGGLFAGVDGLDDRCGARHGVAAGKHAGGRGLEGHVIDIEVDPLVDGDSALLRYKTEVAGLPDGRDDGVALDDEFGALDGNGAPAAAGIGLAQFHAEALDTRHLAVFADDAGGGHEELEADPFLLGLLDLLDGGGHLGPGPAVEDEDVLGARADGRADGIHGHVSAADDGDLLAQEYLLAQVDALQVVDAVDHALHVLAGDVELARELCAHAEEQGVVVLAELLQGDRLADLLVAEDLHAHVGHGLDLGVEDVAGQAVLGDAEGHPSAGDGGLLVDGDVIALDRQVVGAGQARGAGADDGDLLALLFLDLGDVLGGVVEVEVGHEALQVHDVDGLLDLAAHAGLFTGVVADATADRREGVFLLDELEGFLVLADGDEGHIALDADMGRAGRLAGRRAELVDGVPAGDGLGEMPEGGLPVVEVLVEIGGDRDGADGGAVAASRALGEIDVPGRFCELDGEAAGLAFDGFHRPAGQDLHVGVPADLDELGREDAGRAVVGGKRLVELGHDPADADPVLDHVDLHPGIRKVQGGLDTGDAGTHHHDGTNFSILLIF